MNKKKKLKVRRPVIRDVKTQNNKGTENGPTTAAEHQYAKSSEPTAEPECTSNSAQVTINDITTRIQVKDELSLERALYQWYSGYQKEKGDAAIELHKISVPVLLKKALLICKKFKCSDELMSKINKDWIRTWRSRYGLKTDSIPEFSETLSSYSDDQIYFLYAFQFDLTSLPDKTLDNHHEKVWLLSAGNKSGRHRTRFLVIGKHWRPKCLQHVNMLSQPVIYAGGGVGILTPDLFSWWFHREFVPAALSLNSKAILLAGDNTFLPKDDKDCLSADSNVKLIKTGAKNLDNSLVPSEFRIRYASLVLNSALIDKTKYSSVSAFLSDFNLKSAFPLLHKAWLNVRPETFTRNFDILSSSCELTLHSEEDRLLFLELQWLSHDLGLEVTDVNLKYWVKHGVNDKSCEDVESKPSETIDLEDVQESNVPSASDCVDYLSKVLMWMESEPMDPNMVLNVRDVLTIAKQASKIGLGAGHPFFVHNGDPLGQPPPAHMGIPPYHLDKAAGEYWRTTPPIQDIKRLLAASGLSRPSMYPFSAGQYPYPILSPDMTQVAASWHSPSMYPTISSGSGFRGPYPSSLPITSTSLPSDFYRFSPTSLMAAHPGLSPHSHPAIVTPGPKQELLSDHNHR
ncbi:hypothetical protein M8J75_014281 [Diaphorina citri]|nr:hypothetical protein M8J75_014281 [Diaphorina citri]